MEGLIFAAVLIVGGLVLALASMVHALGKQVVNREPDLAAIHADSEAIRGAIAEPMPTINAARKTYLGNRPFWFDDERVYSNEHADALYVDLTASERERWDAGDASVLDTIFRRDVAPIDASSGTWPPQKPHNGRHALHARNSRRGWVKKPQKAKPA